MLKLLSMMAARHLLDRPVRTAITILGVGLGVALAVAIRTANVTVLQSFQESVMAVAGRATLQAAGGELGVDETIITAIRQHPAVVSATPLIHQQARVAAGAQEGKPFMIMGMDLLEAADLKSFHIREEGQQEPDLERFLALNAIFVGVRLAAEWDLKRGSPLAVVVGTKRYDLVVEGIVESGPGLTALWESVGIMDIAAAQGLFGLVGRLDRIDIETVEGSSVAEVMRELQVQLPASVTVSRPARRNEQVERMLRAFQLNLTTLSAVGLIVGLLLVYNTVAFIVVQRRRQIGIMRAYGMRRGAVLALFLIEAAFIGSVGGAIGSAVGIVWARTLVSLLARTVSELYVAVPVERLDELLQLPLQALLEGAVLGVGVSMAGAIAPALEGSRTAPARAVASGGYESSRRLHLGRLGSFAAAGLLLAIILAIPGPLYGVPVFGYAAALVLLLSLASLAPVLVRAASWLAETRGWLGNVSWRRIALEHVARTPGRSGITIAALMIGIAIMLGVGIMIYSFRQTVEAWINQTIMADLIVAPPSWLQGEESGMLARRIPATWQDIVGSVPGVDAIDPYREITVELQGKPSALVSRDLRLHARKSRYLFFTGDSPSILEGAALQEGVLTSEALARAMDLRAGSRLHLRTPAGDQEFPVLGIFYDYATDGGKVVMDRQLYRRLWKDDSITVLAVYLKPGVDHDAVRRQIIEAVGREGELIVVSNAELKQEVLTIFDRTFAVTYALELTAVVIGLLGIVNTLLIATLERRRELATLRAIGASAVHIRRLVLWESAYLGLIGAALGIIGGVLLAVLLIEVINKQSFGWTVQLSVSTRLLLEAAGLAVAVSLLAGYWPARWASRQRIADGLRYE